MIATWAARLNRREADVAASLRTWPGIEVCEVGDSIWLRGKRTDESLDIAIRKLPGGERFEVLPDGQLRAADTRVPKGWLPEGEWKPLEQWITLEPQPAALPGVVPGRVEIQLVRATDEREPNVLVTEMGRWAAYAVEASEIRLRPLMFAVAADGRVLVRGSPLPPLPGLRYVEHDRVAIPCGLRFSPPVEPAVLHQLLDLAPEELALFATDGSFERVASDHFVRARRSAARATQQPMSQETVDDADESHDRTSRTGP